MTGKFVEHKQNEYQRRRDQWEAEKLAYIAEHGQKAWAEKVDREIRELYPETPEIKPARRTP